MDPALVVVHGVKRDRVGVVLDLLREGVGKARDLGIDIRMASFCRSAYDVFALARSGLPLMRFFSTEV